MRMVGAVLERRAGAEGLVGRLQQRSSRGLSMDSWIMNLVIRAMGEQKE